MTFDELVEFCLSEYELKPKSVSSYRNIHEVNTILEFRRYLETYFGQTILVRVSQDQAFYQIVSK